MADITPTAITEAGIKHPFADADPAGDNVVATGLGPVLVEFRNTSAGPITVTLTVPAVSVDDPTYGVLTKTNPVVVLAADEESVFSLKKPIGLINDKGQAPFTYSDATGLKIRALRV